MVHKVNIEIMVDTNANSRKIDGDYETVREMAEQQEAGHARTIREFRDYMRQARAVGVEYEVTQRDTAQIFHEKTNLFTPKLAALAGKPIYPDFVRENLEAGHYHVEPPRHGEDAYYDALQTFLTTILPDKAPEDMEKLESIPPVPGKDASEGELKAYHEKRGLVLQELYGDHMVGLSGKYRKSKQYRDAFDEYREVRFNAGEVTAINFLRDHPHPPEGERTAFVFVGSDKWANQEMAKARKQMRREDEGKFEVFVVEPEKFRGLMEQVIRDVEKSNPEMRDLRKASFRELAYIDGDSPTMQADARLPHHAAQPMQDTAHRAVVKPVSDEAKAFSSFVSRLSQEDRGSDRSR